MSELLQARHVAAGVLAEQYTPNEQVREFAANLSIAALLGVTSAGKERHGSRAIAEVQNSGVVAANRVRSFATRAMRPEERAMDIPTYEHYYDLTNDVEWRDLTSELITGSLVQAIRHRSGKVYGSRVSAYDPRALNFAEYTAETCRDLAGERYFGDFSTNCIVPEFFNTWMRYFHERDGIHPEDYDARLEESWMSLAIALHEPELDTTFVVNNYGENDNWRPAYIALADSYLRVEGEQQLDEQGRAREAAATYFSHLSEFMGREPAHGLQLVA